MIAADSTDGRLTLPDYRVLADDKHAFAPYQACLLVRQDILSAEPQLRAYLGELSRQVHHRGGPQDERGSGPEPSPARRCRGRVSGSGRAEVKTPLPSAVTT